MRHIELALDTGAIQSLEYQLPVKGGKGDYEARIAVSGEDEVMVIVRDITDRKEAQRMATELALKAKDLESLERIDQLRKDLISTVSHELRTPLASIKGYISTLLQPRRQVGTRATARVPESRRSGGGTSEPAGG